MIHVECDRLDGATFCGGRWHDGDVQHGTWANDPSQIQRADCTDCLRKLIEIGKHADARLWEIDRDYRCEGNDE